jgi:hypothetical protein
VFDRETSPHQKPSRCRGDEQDGEGVDQPGRGVGPQRLRIERAVGQGELQVPGDEAGVQGLAVGVDPAGDDRQRGHARQVEPPERAQHRILPGRDVGLDLFDGQDAAGQLDETDDVPRDTAGKRGEMVVGPVLQRDRPRQVEQGRIWSC